MLKVFISQPMNGKTNKEIYNERKHLIDKLNKNGYEVIDSVIEDEVNNPVYLLGESIKLLSEADYIYMMDGWDNGRGCRIEKLVADSYNIPVLDKEEIWEN